MIAADFGNLGRILWVRDDGLWASSDEGDNWMFLTDDFGPVSDFAPLFLPTLSTDCSTILFKEKIWIGRLAWGCEPSTRQTGASSLKLTSSIPSVVEVYSPLIQVDPNTIYRVSYWVRTDLTVDGADMYGKVITAQYNAQAQESDSVNENRLDPGFALGTSVGDNTDWTLQSYTFTSLPGTAYVRLRAVMGGPVGTAQGSAWFEQVQLSKD